LQRERDFQLRRAITKALAEGITSSAEGAPQAEEEKQRAEAAGQVDEQERPAQVARQVEQNVQEPRVVPRNEISGSGVKIITHRRSRNRWAVIAAAALMALTIAGGGYSLYKVQQRIEATQKGAGATQRAEAAQKVAAGQEKRLVGTWKRM
jgi:hypothetical protein